jgi:chromosome segregation ATPase
MFWFEGNYHWCWVILFMAGLLFGIAYLRRRNKEVWDEEIARIQSFLRNLTPVALTDTRKLLSPDLKLDEMRQEMKKRSEQMLLLEKDIASKQSALSLENREYEQISKEQDERKRLLAELAHKLNEVEACYDDASRIYEILSNEVEQKSGKISDLYQRLTSVDTEYNNWVNKIRELTETL